MLRLRIASALSNLGGPWLAPRCIPLLGTWYIYSVLFYALRKSGTKLGQTRFAQCTACPANELFVGLFCLLSGKEARILFSLSEAARGDCLFLSMHILHPNLPELAFAGFNYGFMHLSAVELGMQWLQCP